MERRLLIPVMVLPCDVLLMIMPATNGNDVDDKRCMLVKIYCFTQI
jgi:hypothetical protein